MLRKGGGKKLRLKTAGPCFSDHIIPYDKAKMLYLSNLEKNFFRIAGALKLHFFGFSVLTISVQYKSLSTLIILYNFSDFIHVFGDGQGQIIPLINTVISSVVNLKKNV